MALLCIKVFIGRFIEVTLSTMNTLYIVKGKKIMATIIGFIDILIWFLIVSLDFESFANSNYLSKSSDNCTKTYFLLPPSSSFNSNTA